MSLEQLSVHALHRFDAANSRLRHSIVEACFYNLRMLSQELPGRRGDSRFTQNLNDSLSKIESAKKLIDEYFDYQVRNGLRVADLFRDEHHVVDAALNEIEDLAKKGTPTRNETAACERFAETVVASLDAILDAIDQIRRRVNEFRVDIGGVLGELVFIQESACEAQGVRIEFRNASDTEVRAFVDREQLLNALGEMVRNALRHGFPEAGSENATIEVRLDVDPDTRDILIDIRDNGCGIPADRLEMVGAAGASTTGGGDGVAMVRQIIEKDHLGLVAYESEPGRGTHVHIRLPRRAEPEIEPGPEDTGRPVLVRKRSARAIRSRKRLARLVAYGMTLIGLVTAWGVHESLKERPIIVAADGSGDYTRLARAIAVAPKGARLIVRPGAYVGPLRIDKTLTLSGAGEASEAILRASDGNTVHISAGDAVLRNLRIVCDGDSEKAVAVLVTGGRPKIENCSVGSEALSAIEVAGADPIVRRCKIRSARHSGLLIHRGGRGLYHLNRIEDCGGAGISVMDGAAPRLQNNVVVRCRDGIRIGAGITRGTCEGNVLTECERAGMIVGTGSSPIVRECEFTNNRRVGLWLLEGAKGSYDFNRFVANAIAGIIVESSAEPLLRSNLLRDHRQAALWLRKGAAGAVSDTTFEGGARNIHAEEGARTEVTPGK